MKFIFLSIALFGSLFSSFSQNISGTIKNQKGEALPFASIYLLNAKVSTTSYGNGGFHLKMLNDIIYPKLDTLLVSYIGYTPYKKVVDLKKENQKIHITLESSLTQLKEFEVKVLTPYSPEKIIKLALKKTKKNYSQDHTVSNGFYRELVKEEENWIMLNEAAIQLKYSPYPQKGFLNQAFHAYYKYDHRPWNISPATPFVNMLRFTSFLPLHKDQVCVISSRTSLNHSKYGKEVSPVGGPGDLVALDKIKYRYDFFDPKLMKQYNYKLVNEEYYNGEKCYVIDFYPKKSYQKRI